MPEVQVQNAVAVDLASARFRAGVGRGQWKQVSYAFPVLVVAAIEPDGKTSEYYFRFELSGFPGTAPEVTIWDPATNALVAADKRPKGSERVNKAFQVWDSPFLPSSLAVGNLRSNRSPRTPIRR